MMPMREVNQTEMMSGIKGFSLRAKAKLNGASTLGKRSRNEDHEEEDEEEVRREAVTGFGDDGAITRDSKEKVSPLVIQPLRNRDWKAEARARRGVGKNLLPRGEGKAQDRASLQREGNRNETGEHKREEGVDVVNSNDGDMEWGLSVKKRIRVKEEIPVEQADPDSHGQAQNGLANSSSPESDKMPPTADEEALEALIRGGKQEDTTAQQLVIIPRSPSPPPPRTAISEQVAYQRAIANAPEASTLADYERIPVEQFGAALLRGMGWTGTTVGGPKEVTRRPNLLGLGATQLKEAEELGAWVNKSDSKRLQGATPARVPSVADYRRRDERRRDIRDGRMGSYKRDRERERDRSEYRDRNRDRDRDRDRDWLR